MASKKFVIARQLGGKRVITNSGEELGRLADLTIDEDTGRIEGLLIEVNSDSKTAGKLQRVGKLGHVPYKSVFAVSDVIVVDESLIT